LKKVQLWQREKNRPDKGIEEKVVEGRRRHADQGTGSKSKKAYGEKTRVKAPSVPGALIREFFFDEGEDGEKSKNVWGEEEQGRLSLRTPPSRKTVFFANVSY